MIYKKNKLIIDGFKIDYLARKYKTPIYCYSLKKIKDNIENLKRNFKKINPLICYAVKANTNLSILREIKNYNLGADVVSIGELKKALKAGISPKKIVFSGVGKTFAPPYTEEDEAHTIRLTLLIQASNNLTVLKTFVWVVSAGFSTEYETLGSAAW